MWRNKKIGKWNVWEVLFQVVLLSLVFIFYAFERFGGQVYARVDASEVAFFLNYTVAAMIINYVLLPRLLYRKKYVLFSLFTLLILAIVIFIEEGVIEQIYFPDTRGKRFPGVFVNLMAALPSITILVGFKFAWDALRKQRQLEELPSMVKESELQFLKTQINPHFLFNNLNNLYAHALEQSPKTPQIILELSGVLRYMLYECMEATVPLTKEVEQLENFVNLSKLQFENRGVIRFETGALGSGYRIAPLILSVFLENAFKHSASSQNDNIEIVISLKWKGENTLVFQCRNSYSEQSNTHDLSKGIGLENVRKRLALIYPDRHEMHLKDENGVYDVTLAIELEKH